MRLLTLAAAVLLIVPGAAVAQSTPDMPDHWLTAESLAHLLSLTPEQQAQVGPSYEALNQLLKRAVQRRDDLRAEMRNTPRVTLMSDNERQALQTRLEGITVEYQGRQAEIDQQLAAIRALLTPAQQVRFDALAKPKLMREQAPAQP